MHIVTVIILHMNIWTLYHLTDACELKITMQQRKFKAKITIWFGHADKIYISEFQPYHGQNYYKKHWPGMNMPFQWLVCDRVSEWLNLLNCLYLHIKNIKLRLAMYHIEYHSMRFKLSDYGFILLNCSKVLKYDS